MPPGDSVLRVVRFTATVAGTVETFDEALYQRQLGAILDVPTAMIELNVQAASVTVEAAITTTNVALAARVRNDLQNFTPETLSAALGFTIEVMEPPSMEDVLVLVPRLPPMPPSPPDCLFTCEMEQAIATAAALLLVLLPTLLCSYILCLVVTRCRRRRKGKGQPPPTQKPLRKGRGWFWKRKRAQTMDVAPRDDDEELFGIIPPVAFMPTDDISIDFITEDERRSRDKAIAAAEAEAQAAAAAAEEEINAAVAAAEANAHAAVEAAEAAILRAHEMEVAVAALKAERLGISPAQSPSLSPMGGAPRVVRQPSAVDVDGARSRHHASAVVDEREITVVVSPSVQPTGAAAASADQAPACVRRSSEIKLADGRPVNTKPTRVRVRTRKTERPAQGTAAGVEAVLQSIYAEEPASPPKAAARLADDPDLAADLAGFRAATKSRPPRLYRTPPAEPAAAAAAADTYSHRGTEESYAYSNRAAEASFRAELANRCAELNDMTGHRRQAPPEAARRAVQRQRRTRAQGTRPPPPPQPPQPVQPTQPTLPTLPTQPPATRAGASAAHSHFRAAQIDDYAAMLGVAAARAEVALERPDRAPTDNGSSSARNGLPMVREAYVRQIV